MNKQYDIKGLIDTSFSLQSPFLKKSKEHLGKGWEERLEYRGLLYVLPRWSSQDFFNLHEDEIKHLFEICDVYISESPVDQGVLVASSKPLQDKISKVIDDLKREDIVFS